MWEVLRSGLFYREVIESVRKAPDFSLLISQDAEISIYSDQVIQAVSAV